MMKTELLRLLPRLTLSLVLPLACLAQSPSAATPDDPIAEVAGQPIYEKDLTAAMASQMMRLRDQEYQIKSRALDEVIREKVLEAEAKKRGLSTEELLKQEVDSKIGEPTDAVLEGYYLAQKDRINRPFDEVKAQIRAAFMQARVQQARQEYEDSLRKKAEVAVYLRPPKINVTYDAARVKGDPKAPITIVEFSDFQCPFCKRADDTLKEVLTKYSGKVKLAYRDFPLSQIHPNAQNAAEASRCAGAQGKFWEYHDALFADQSKLDKASLTDRAKKLSLDEKSFQSCLDTGKFKAQVDADEQDGEKAGVNGTPGFFINGTFLSGAQPVSEFEKVIDTELAAAGPRRASR
ncbi:MAG TPA: thioredoxin domain-containing protein [Bryobacterales bacterium]|nr:thioredoxin domain-containing protein [Bryobacterales bacterium]